MTTPSDLAYRHELQALREHVDLKLSGIEQILDRTAATLDKLAESNVRLAVIEQKAAGLDRRLDTLEREQKDVSHALTRFVAYASGIGVVAGGLIATFGKLLLEKVMG